MRESLSRFASFLAVFLGFSLAAACLHAGIQIARQDYVRLVFLRSAASTAKSDLDAGAFIACLLAVAIFPVIEWLLPAFRRLLGRAPRWLARSLPSTILAALALRVGWSVSRAEIFHSFSRSLGAPGAAGLAVAMAVLAVLAAIRIEKRPFPLRWTSAGIGLMGSVMIAPHALLGLAPAGKSIARPNVLLVSLDTVRADRVRCYGYARPTTPGIDALAAGATLFEAAIAPAPWTLPSHASMLTGLYPHSHGAAGWRSILPPRHVTLAETLLEAGYETAAFTGGAYLSSRFGLMQGFDVVEPLDGASTSAVVARALGWLHDRRRKGPFFLFVHTYEPHTPYLDRSFASPSDAGRVGETFTLERLEALRSGRLDPTPAERRYISDLYDGDLRATDAALIRLWDWLRESGEMDRTVVIVTSDHGEELFERDVRRSAGHGHSLYEEIVRVPLVVRFPPVFSSGRRVRTPVSLVDIAPTVAGLLGTKWPAPADGCDLTQLEAGSPAMTREGVLSEAFIAGRDRRSLRTGRYKFITPTGAPAAEAELYDLDADPGERRSLSGDVPEIAGRLAARIRAYPLIASKNADVEVDTVLRRQLRSLGYIR